MMLVTLNCKVSECKTSLCRIQLHLKRWVCGAVVITLAFCICCSREAHSHVKFPSGPNLSANQSELQEFSRA